MDTKTPRAGSRRVKRSRYFPTATDARPDIGPAQRREKTRKPARPRPPVCSGARPAPSGGQGFESPQLHRKYWSEAASGSLRGERRGLLTFGGHTFAGPGRSQTSPRRGAHLLLRWRTPVGTDTETRPATAPATMTLAELPAFLAVGPQALYDLRSKSRARPASVSDGTCGSAPPRSRRGSGPWRRPTGAGTPRADHGDPRASPHPDRDVRADRAHRPGRAVPGADALRQPAGPWQDRRVHPALADPDCAAQALRRRIRQMGPDQAQVTVFFNRDGESDLPARPAPDVPGPSSRRSACATPARAESSGR